MIKEATDQNLPSLTGNPEFEAFKKKYISLFHEMMKYSPDQVGSQAFAEKMADMDEQHPDWVAKIEEDIEEAHYGKQNPIASRSSHSKKGNQRR